MNPQADKMYAKKEADANTQIRVGVGLIIRDQRGWILLEKRKDCGLWGLPGGKIEPGESIIKAAMREAKEETNLTIQVERLLGVYSEPQDRIVTYLDNGDVVQLVDIILAATIVSGELSYSSESEDLQFYDPMALPSDIVPPAILPLRNFIHGFVGVIK